MVSVILVVLTLVMVYQILLTLSTSTDLNTSNTNNLLEWLMACRVMVLTEGETTGTAAIDDMDAIPVIDADLTTDGDITNAL